MPLYISEAVKADIPAIVELYFTTFNSPIVLKLKPNVPPVRDWFRRSLQSDMDKPYTFVYKVLDDHSASDATPSKIIAFAKWTSPQPETQDETSLDPPAEGDAALFEQVIGKATEQKKQILRDEQHWYLAVIATLPEHQRRGAASLLMTELCKQADQSGHRSYVEASPLGKSTYEQFGFEQRGSFSTMIDGEPYVDCCMVREPQKAIRH